MMVETMLESSQDFGMSNGPLPQWKRELLQRRAARSRPAPAPAPAHAPPPPLPAAAADDDEELRYGPGIVKRLKSRYLSLALRDAPRRRPSVLRRAASLEHLLDERPPPAPRPPSTRPPRPASVAAPPPILAPYTRRDVVKRARSVDALSRLDSRDDHHPPSPSPPPPHALPPQPPLPLVPPPSIPAPPPHAPPPPPPAPRPPIARTARPPRRPAPLLRETERPPPDVVRSTLRKFESAPPRRTAPAARVSAVLRGLEGPSRTSTPEPRDPPPPPPPRSPTPPPIEVVTPVSIEETEGGVVSLEARPVSRAALEGIARAGSSMRFAFEAPRRGSHLPPLAAANQVLIGRARRVGVIRPMPAPLRSPEPPVDLDQKFASPPSTPRLASPQPQKPEPEPEPSPTIRLERKDAPPSALVEPIPRSPPEERAPESPRLESSRDPEPELIRPKIERVEKPLTNGHAELKPKGEEPLSRLGGADIERAWNGTADKKLEPKEKKVSEIKETKSGVAVWGAGSPQAARRPRAPPPASTSIVFNFSDRKEVPDYIENDGIILRGSRRNRIKPGEPGVVVLRPEAVAAAAGSSEDEGDGEAGPPSPCEVRFVNDNVLINGKSSMPHKPNRDRTAKLKLQFDDSLTRTFEYPSETSLSEDAPAASHAASTLAANTHIASAALARYTPSKTRPDGFQLGVTRHEPAPAARPQQHTQEGSQAGVEACGAGAEAGGEAEGGAGVVPGGGAGAVPGGGAGAVPGGGGDARPCAAHHARSWSESRTHATDLLF